MSKLLKYSTFCLLVILASTILLAGVNAQDDILTPPPFPNFPPDPPETEEAIIVVAAALGGTTDPEPGTYTYTYADTIMLEATPNSGYKFLRWVISGRYLPGHNIPPIVYPANIDIDDQTYIPNFPEPTDVQNDRLTISTNPLNVICGYGYTYVYQPIFTPTSTPPSTNNAIVVVVDSIGGSTDPEPGTYYFAEESSIQIEATPEQGYEFDSWVAEAEGETPVQLVDNPLSIECGFGYEYEYQAMFRPIGTSTTEEAIPMYIYAIIAVLAIIAVIGVGAALMYRGKSK